MEVWGIVHGIAVEAFQRSGPSLAQHPWGYCLLPLVTYFLQLRRNKSPWNWQKWKAVFHDTLSAALIVISCVFVVQFIGSMYGFLNPVRMACPAPPPEMPEPPPAQGVYVSFTGSPRTALVKVNIAPTATFLPDGHIGVVPIIQNVSGRTLKTTGSCFQSFIPQSFSPLERVKFEDYLWETFINENEGKAKNPKVVFELSTVGDGSFQQKLATGPYSDDQRNQILAGTASLYFLELVTDTTAGKSLAEFCVYVRPDKALGLCHKHNMP
jgi:hypothetical protein